MGTLKKLRFSRKISDFCQFSLKLRSKTEIFVSLYLLILLQKKSNKSFTKIVVVIGGGLFSCSSEMIIGVASSFKKYSEGHFRQIKMSQDTGMKIKTFDFFSLSLPVEKWSTARDFLSNEYFQAKTLKSLENATERKYAQFTVANLHILQRKIVVQN